MNASKDLESGGTGFSNPWKNFPQRSRLHACRAPAVALSWAQVKTTLPANSIEEDKMEADSRKTILRRWHALHQGEGLKHAMRVCRILWALGFIACLATIACVLLGLHPIFPTLISAVMGWLVAESNALRTRLSQWPVMESYINWDRVQSDLNVEIKYISNQRT